MPAPYHANTRRPMPPSYATGPQNRVPRRREKAPAEDNRPPRDEQGRAAALEIEIERLRQELAFVRQQKTAADFDFSPTSAQLVWVALAICGAALLFTLMAFWLKG